MRAGVTPHKALTFGSVIRMAMNYQPFPHPSSRIPGLAEMDQDGLGELLLDQADKWGDMLGHRRIQVETRLKLLAKRDPNRYGEKISQEISDPDGGPVHTESDFRPAPEDETVT